MFKMLDEGIRPTSALRTPESVKEFLKPDEYKLYSLIYARSDGFVDGASKIRCYFCNVDE